MNKDLQNILVKVSALYHKYGIKSVTMDDVAHELGISKKTLYQYVTDKTELVKQVVDFVQKSTLEYKKLKLKGKNAIEELIEVGFFLRRIMKERSPTYEYDLKKYYPEIFQKQMLKRREHMYRSMIDNLVKGKEEGLYREDLDEKVIAKLYMFRAESLAGSEIFTDEERSSGQFFMEVFLYHIHGIASEKGLEVLKKHNPRFQKAENYSE